MAFSAAYLLNSLACSFVPDTTKMTLNTYCLLQIYGWLIPITISIIWVSQKLTSKVVQVKKTAAIISGIHALISLGPWIVDGQKPANPLLACPLDFTPFANKVAVCLVSIEVVAFLVIGLARVLSLQDYTVVALRFVLFIMYMAGSSGDEGGEQGRIPNDNRGIYEPNASLTQLAGARLEWLADVL